MGLAPRIAELSRECSIGVKTSSKGHSRYWRGYKLHLDVADGQIPISALLTGANVHDSQVAIPLATITAQRVTSLYDLMDSAYDAYEIIEHSRSLGHVPIITPRNSGRRTNNVIVRKQPRQLSWAEQQRFGERTMAERVYSRLLAMTVKRARFRPRAPPQRCWCAWAQFPAAKKGAGMRIRSM